MDGKRNVVWVSDPRVYYVVWVSDPHYMYFDQIRARRRPTLLCIQIDVVRVGAPHYVGKTASIAGSLGESLRVVSYNLHIPSRR